jgi:hypothetical protein
VYAATDFAVSCDAVEDSMFVTPQESSGANLTSIAFFESWSTSPNLVAESQPCRPLIVLMTYAGAAAVVTVAAGADPK